MEGNYAQYLLFWGSSQRLELKSVINASYSWTLAPFTMFSLFLLKPAPPSLIALNEVVGWTRHHIHHFIPHCVQNMEPMF